MSGRHTLNKCTTVLLGKPANSQLLKIYSDLFESVIRYSQSHITLVTVLYISFHSLEHISYPLLETDAIFVVLNLRITHWLECHVI